MTSPLRDIRREESFGFQGPFLRADQKACQDEKELVHTIKSIRFDENYVPSDNTRATTNFANLARGNRRRENLRNAFTMINNRFNASGRIDKMDSTGRRPMIQAHLYVGDDLGTQPDVRR